MDPRRPVRSRAVPALAAALTTLVLTGCANDPRFYPHSEQQSAGLDESPLSTLLIFVVAPLLVGLVIAALVWIPGMVRGARYRPGKGWAAAPVWFAGPSDPVAALEHAETGDVQRGGSGGSW